MVLPKVAHPYPAQPGQAPAKVGRESDQIVNTCHPMIISGHSSACMCLSRRATSGRYVSDRARSFMAIAQSRTLFRAGSSSERALTSRKISPLFYMLDEQCRGSRALRRRWLRIYPPQVDERREPESENRWPGLDHATCDIGRWLCACIFLYWSAMPSISMAALAAALVGKSADNGSCGRLLGGGTHRVFYFEHCRG